MSSSYRKLASLLAIVGALLLAGCATSMHPPSADVQHTLAPSGKLRVGLYPGSPTSIIGDPAAGTAKGVGYDLGREMADRLGVPFEPVVFPKNAEVLAAAKAGKVDFVFTNATASRAKFLDFSPHVLFIEKGYLVPSGSHFMRNDEVDRSGTRIGASQGSSTVKEMHKLLKHASVKQVPTLKKAAEMMADGELDAYATNKAILYQMSDGLPGSRVLEGHWGMEHFAVGVPKGREKGEAFLREFVADAIAHGQVAQAVKRVGVRGTVLPTAR